jgi:hypothetical protein
MLGAGWTHLDAEAQLIGLARGAAHASVTVSK